MRLRLMTGMPWIRIQICAKKSVYKLYFCKLTPNIKTLTGSCYMKENLQLVLQMSYRL